MTPLRFRPVLVLVFWILTSRAARAVPLGCPLTCTRWPSARAVNADGCPLSQKSVVSVVVTVRPATTSEPAGVVGGSDSILPSSCSSDPRARRSDSSTAVEPSRLTAIVTVWPDCTSVSGNEVSRFVAVKRSVGFPGGTFFSENWPAASTDTELFEPATETRRPAGATDATDNVDPVRPAVDAVDPLPPPDATMLPLTVTELDGDDGELLLQADTTAATSRRARRFNRRTGNLQMCEFRIDICKGPRGPRKGEQTPFPSPGASGSLERAKNSAGTELSACKTGRGRSVLSGELQVVG